MGLASCHEAQGASVEPEIPKFGIMYKIHDTILASQPIRTYTRWQAASIDIDPVEMP